MLQSLTSCLYYVHICTFSHLETVANDWWCHAKKMVLLIAGVGTRHNQELECRQQQLVE